MHDLKKRKNIISYKIKLLGETDHWDESIDNYNNFI